ncbi:hypothetical protein BCD_1225 (plasmid) [Borrelia crocidurae DOU]|uniref:Uncharacterized protein n=1 Tax=Borrelia crocidurae DOU TaxID=1293575 RepID=W5SQC3_9SPIR|nr:hypothetical protein BCD_1225 [Borrelia crocidurae DOU]
MFYFFIAFLLKIVRDKNKMDTAMNEWINYNSTTHKNIYIKLLIHFDINLKP